MSPPTAGVIASAIFNSRKHKTHHHNPAYKLFRLVNRAIIERAFYSPKIMVLQELERQHLAFGRSPSSSDVSRNGRAYQGADSPKKLCYQHILRDHAHYLTCSNAKTARFGQRIYVIMPYRTFGALPLPWVELLHPPLVPQRPQLLPAGKTQDVRYRRTQSPGGAVREIQDKYDRCWTGSGNCREYARMCVPNLCAVDNASADGKNNSQLPIGETGEKWGLRFYFLHLPN